MILNCQVPAGAGTPPGSLSQPVQRVKSMFQQSTSPSSLFQQGGGGSGGKLNPPRLPPPPQRSISHSEVGTNQNKYGFETG